MEEDLETLVSKYIRLRDAIKQADEKHKERMRPSRDMLEDLNNQLLARLNELGGESVRTAAGTCYRTTKKSASIADGSAFRDWIIGHEAWDMVDWRANPLAVQDFIESHEAPPPGVNYSQTFVVGVRRS